MICQPERATQYKVLRTLQGLGYRYLGNWRQDDEERARKSPIEREWLAGWLRGRGEYTEEETGKALLAVEACVVTGRRNLAQANREMYRLLYHGVQVEAGAGEQTRTVRLIDWEHPERNEYGVAEEVSMQRVAGKTRRPDVVLYINGIAFAVLELKKTNELVAEGIRQNLTNQRPGEIPYFFTSIQLVMAGTENEGLRYGVAGTPEKYFLSWKRDPQDDPRTHLLEHVEALCSKETILELAYDFMVWHRGAKKVARQNQYHGIKAAQAFVRRREGGIIWHTQGSGKSLMMVWLAKWILRSNPAARVFIITDRVELDEQIEDNFRSAEMTEVYRTRNGGDLVRQLDNATYPVVCTLIQKFRGVGQELTERDVDDFVQQMQSSIPTNFSVKGDVHVFVDECHRSESGKLKKAMDLFLKNGVYYGFTGTPILSIDKKNTLAIFGNFIHCYKFDEAVRDGVVLDLLYESRFIGQRVTDKRRLDALFAVITRGKSAEAVRRIKAEWGTMRKLHSVEDRIKAISRDIWADFMSKPRLADNTGTAILVAGSVFNAFRYYEALCKLGDDFAGRCAVVSSFVPAPSVLRTEGEDTTESRYKYDTSLRMLRDFSHLSGVAQDASSATADQVQNFEKRIKQMFIREPERMRLLIVVDKLLTGFDAPSATYLYIDKKMRDHGLFQAVCRVNRLDDETKEYGYVVDYQNLFSELEAAYDLYAGEDDDIADGRGGFRGYDKEDVDGLLKDKNLMNAKKVRGLLERLHQLCENVAEPKGASEYCAYFCQGDEEVCRKSRNLLYSWAPALVRAFAQIKGEMGSILADNGAFFFTEEEQGAEGSPGSIEKWVKHYSDAYEWVELFQGDRIDRKAVGAEMRRLLDAYVGVEPTEVLSTLGDKSLVELLAERPGQTVQGLHAKLKKPRAVAETIINNIRHEITDRHAENPRFYDEMSKILESLVQQLREDAMAYRAFLNAMEKAHAAKAAARDILNKLGQLAKDVLAGGRAQDAVSLPGYVGNSPRRRQLYQNAPKNWDPELVQRFVESMDLCWARFYVPGEDVNSPHYLKFHMELLKALDNLTPGLSAADKDALAGMIFEMACKQ
ncbi:MAG: HsdR family type I site-specific deoxyribonuclease [Akkermansia sp.]|nr:HsdR family type I site-specific deoxyribonuclease [Akkermansia sp.]